MNVRKCSFFNLFFLRLTSRNLARWTACSVLFGKGCLFSRKGRGAIQLPVWSLRNSPSICFINILSSIDLPSLSSCLLLMNSFESYNKDWSTVSLMPHLLLHGFNNVGRPVDKRNVFLTLRSREACTMLRQVSPITTHPSLSCCAYGAFGGPKIWCRTWRASIRSRPISRRIWQLSSRGRICLVISKRCEWCRVTSGVAISSIVGYVVALKQGREFKVHIAFHRSHNETISSSSRSNHFARTCWYGVILWLVHHTKELKEVGCC